MSESKHHRWLQQQIDYWQQEAILSPEQSDQLRRRYPVADHSNWLRVILAASGGLIFGLGIILFFAYNWQDMHRYAKVAVVFIMLGVAHGGAYWYDKKRLNAGGEGLALLATVLFGAAIWLLSQIYHIEGHYPNVFFVWGLAAYGMAWGRYSLVQAIASAGLLVTWSALEISINHSSLHYSPLLLMLMFWPLLYRVAMPRLMLLFNFTVAILMLITLFSWNAEQGLVLIYSLSIASILFGYWRQGRFSVSFLLPGFIGYFGFLYAFTFVEFADELFRLVELPIWVGMPMIMVLFVLPALWQIWQRQVVWHLLLTMLTSAWALLMIYSQWLPIASAYALNLLLIAHCVVLVRDSFYEQKGALLVAAVILFLLMVFARYIDLFSSLLLRSATFLVAGAVIFVISHYYQRAKQQTEASQ